PEPVRLAVDLTQVTAGSESVLCFKLSIFNETLSTIRYTAGELILQVAGQNVKPSQRTTTTSVFIEAGMHADAPLNKLRQLPDGDIEPLHRVEGWMCFDLKECKAILEGPDDFAAHEWLLVGCIGEYAVRFDLKAHEIDALGLAVRPSIIDPAVHVIEMRRRINALNVGGLLTAIDSMPVEERGYVLYVREQRCLLDTVADKALLQKLGRNQFGGGVVRGGPNGPFNPQPVLVRVNPDYGRRSCVLDHLPRAISEEGAALQVLAEQPDTGEVLTGYLSGAPSAIRAEAARGLGKHVDEAGVSAALVAAARDADATVRMAALWALAPWRTADDNSPEAMVLVKAMHDRDPGVRIKAAEGATWSQSERVKRELLNLIDDKAPWARIQACHSLRMLKYRPAIPKLKEAMTSRDATLSCAAIDALIEIGELSKFDAALAKIERGNPDVRDVEEAARANDPRAIPALISLLDQKKHGRGGGGGTSSSSTGSVISHAARALGNLHDTQAVEPLLAALDECDFLVEWMSIVEALGRLGDGRAIAPIRKAMRRKPNLDDGLVGYEALLSLKAPGVLDELRERLKQASSPAAVGPLLEVMARHGDERMVPVAEHYLDREEFCSVAAKAMTYLRSSVAITPLERRLKSSDYAFGPQLLNGLRQNQEWLSSEAGQALIEAARQSANDATKAAAAQSRFSPQQPMRFSPSRRRARP
ncbi:MAG: HEAT repeat domain-containing protein, partial [Pirellulales bacterium]